MIVQVHLPVTFARNDSVMVDGYDPTFLTKIVPLPTTERRTAALDYPRFTVVLDLARRLAAVTAVNIDGATLRDIPRTGDWALDSRVPADQQAGPDVYARNDLDRGHLVRRRDPGWGDIDLAREATEATFFYPNAAPQMAGFNQSKELWLGLEDHVLAYAETTDQHLSVFTAPILDPDDPPYRGIRVPADCWTSERGSSPSRSELSVPSKCRSPRSPRPPLSTLTHSLRLMSCRRISPAKRHGFSWQICQTSGSDGAVVLAIPPFANSVGLRSADPTCRAPGRSDQVQLCVTDLRRVRRKRADVSNAVHEEAVKLVRRVPKSDGSSDIRRLLSRSDVAKRAVLHENE
jgi:hypothetical protein